MDFIHYTQLLDFEIEDAFPNLTADDIAAISAQGANGLLYNEQNVVYIGQIDNAYPNYIVKLKLMDPNFNNGGVLSKRYSLSLVTSPNFLVTC